MSFVLCDTNIIISLFKGFSKTVEDLTLIGSENVLLPSVSVMELFRGMENKKDMNEMSKKLNQYNILHLNEKVSERAILYIKDYKLSHNLQIPDALIAAMAVEYHLPLYTYNVKDFKFIPKLKLYKG